MIKTEVVFDGHDIIVNGWTVHLWIWDDEDGTNGIDVYKDGVRHAKAFRELEQAIKYCMEN